MPWPCSPRPCPVLLPLPSAGLQGDQGLGGGRGRQCELLGQPGGPRQRQGRQRRGRRGRRQQGSPKRCEGGWEHILYIFLLLYLQCQVAS